MNLLEALKTWDTSKSPLFFVTDRKGKRVLSCYSDLRGEGQLSVAMLAQTFGYEELQFLTVERYVSPDDPRVKETA